MKKLLIFVVAIMFAFGFSSCDNGVHNSLGEFDGYSISGEGAEGLTFEATGAIPLVKTDDAYTVELVPTSSTITFCFVKTGGNWTGQLGGDVMSATTNIPIGIEFESVDNGNGGFNGTFKNLMANTSYTLIVGGNPSDVQLSLLGSDGIDGTAFYISFYTGKNSSNKINESKNFANADKKVISHKMENKEFSFIFAYKETLYYSVENVVTGEIAEEQKEFKDAVEYLFTVEQNTTTKAFSVKCEEVAALENAVVISNLKHNNDFYKETDFVEGKLGVYITAQRNEFEFYVQRKGSDDLVWAKGNNDIEADTDFVELKYIDNRNISNDASFAPTKITPVKVNGLEVGKIYLVSFNYASAVLSAKVVEAPYPNFDKYALWSNVYGSSWDKGPNNMDPSVLPYPVFETKEKNIYSLEFKPALDYLEFGLKSPESGHTDKNWREGPYNNGSWIGGGASLSGTGKAEFNPIGGDNSKITNLSPDTTYILTLVLTTLGTAEITVVEKN
ncbi:MAG: hypothetical protein HDR52_07315 [Treponema sp.]|nr:hypothetical protein [Treponema sp.]